MKGILDRIEDGQNAVILLEQHEREIILPVEQLPAGSAIGSWFNIAMEDGEVSIILLDETTTAEKADHVSGLLKKLKKKDSVSKFKRR